MIWQNGGLEEGHLQLGGGGGEVEESMVSGLMG